MRLTDRQDSMLLAAAMAGGNLTVRENSTRCAWHVVGVDHADDDRDDIHILIAAGFLVYDERPPRRKLGGYRGPMQSFRLTTTGYRAAWNVSN